MRNIKKLEKRNVSIAKEKRIKSKMHNSTSKEISSYQISKRWVGMFIVVFATFLLLSLISYSPLDNCINVVNAEPISNICRKYGAIVSDLLLQYFGLSSWIIVITLYLWSVSIFAKGHLHLYRKCFWMIISVLSFSIFTGFFSSYNFAMQMLPGGYFGSQLSSIVKDRIGSVIGSILFLLFSCFSFFISVRSDKDLFSLLKEKEIGEKHKKILSRIKGIFIYFLTLGPVIDFFKIFSKWNIIKLFGSTLVATNTGKETEESKSKNNAVLPYHPNEANYKNIITGLDDKKDKIAENSIYKLDKKEESQEGSAPKKQSVNFIAGSSMKDENDQYTPPSINLLLPIAKKAKLNNIDYESRKEILVKSLKDFGVNGKIENFHVGPVVTLYELILEPGIKASRVIGLANDIARSMQVPVIRIADIPSRGIMGVEVPNVNPQSIGLRDIVISPEFYNTKHNIPIVLGQDIMGTPIIDDLAKMPHLLVAGTTGSGKSVGLNCMIISMLYKMSPSKCRFIMIDPKMLELSLYNGVPHLLTPAITDPNQAILAMRWVVNEMQKRNKKMANLSVRNISGYNQKMTMAKMRGSKIIHKAEVGYDPVTQRPIVEDSEQEPETMPYIVVVIDEMADLMMVAGKEMEGLIQRIAQMARAAGIHLIMATQRPSVDVITGVIKANLSTRVSYKVASKVDSGIILGELGAEQLLGNGDMLYLEAGKKPKRVHGPFLSEGEVETIVKDLSSRYKNSYVDIISEIESMGGDGAKYSLNGTSSSGSGKESNNESAMYKMAIEIVLVDKKTSISYLQRKMRIGYNKAANFIEKMEEDGILSAPDTSGKRKILNTTLD